MGADNPIFLKRVGDALADVMTNEWVPGPEGHSPDLKRLLRVNVATLATTGIRPGLEVERVRLDGVIFES